MYRSFYLEILAAALILNGVASADENTEYKSDAYEWIASETLPNYPISRLPATQSGIAYYLSEQQNFWLNSGYEYHTRFAYEVIDRSGLEEGARITISFDPEDTTLSFTSLLIHRGETSLDRLPDVEITELRQEVGLKNNLIDGRSTLVINLEDLKVGDVVDYSYQGRVETLLWPNDYFDSVSVEWSVPLALQTYRIKYPKSRDLTAVAVGTDINVTSVQGADYNEYRVRIEDPDPKPMENNIPASTVSYGYVAFSSMSEWSDVVDWSVDLYDIDIELPIETITRLDQIAIDFPDEDDRIIETLRMVQKEIRYLGIESGLGSHKPRTPRETLQNGYGDCKDKSLLLSVMLRYLGVDAEPALASLSRGHQLDRAPASVGAFDHVIVHIKQDTKSIWLDPTISRQGGRLNSMSHLDYGFVLPIRSGVTSLQEVTYPLPTKPEITSIEQFTFPEDGELGALLDIETTYTGVEADQMRDSLANSGTEKLARGYHDYYSSRYNGIKVSTPFSVVDDFNKNELVITESYVVARDVFDEEMATNIVVVPYLIQDILPSSIGVDRRSQLALPYGINRKHVIRLHTPGRMFFAPDDELFEAPGVTLSQKFDARNEWFDATYNLTVDRRAVETEDISKILKIAEQISDQTNLTINPSAAVPTFARRLNLSETLTTETEVDLRTLSGLALSSKNLETLELANDLLSRYSEENSLRGYVFLIKGAVLLDLGRKRSAKTNLREAFTLHEPSTAGMYLEYAGLLTTDDEAVEAASIIIRMFDADEGSIEKLSIEWLGRLINRLSRNEAFETRSQLRMAAAASQYEAAETFKPKPWIYAAAIRPLVEAGRIDEAEKFIELIEDPEMLVLLKMDRKMEAIWPALDRRSGDDFIKLIDGFVETSEARVLENPDNFVDQTTYLNALMQAGRYDEAITHGASVIENWSRIEAVGEKAFWFVNEYARALTQDGRYADAEQIIDRLKELGMQDHPYLIGIVINQSTSQLIGGRFAEAIAIADSIFADEDNYASDYGEMWLLYSKICALTELDRRDEANTLFAEKVEPLKLENRSALMNAYMCLDREQDAVSTLISIMQEDEERTGAIRMFVQSDDDMTGASAFALKMRERLDAVKNNPNVMSEFNDVARAAKIAVNSAYWSDF